MPDYGLNQDGSSLFDPGFTFNPPPTDFGPTNPFDPNAGSVVYDPGPWDPSGGSTVPGIVPGPFNQPDLGIPSGSDGSGGGIDWGAALAKILGFGGSGGGGSNALMTLLSLLGIGGGAYLAHGASQDAAKQIQQSVTDANSAATKVFQDQGSLYKPYYDAGVAATDRLASMPYSNLAANYQPLGTGRGIRLGALTGH